jgi:hypothetical protein
MFELDVRASADGVVFLLHDSTLDRTTSACGPAESRNWAELQSLDAGAWHSAAYVGDAQAWNAQRQNTLNNLGAIGQGLNQGNQQQMNAGNIYQGQAQQQIEGQKAAWDYKNNQAMNGLLAYKQAISGGMGGVTKQNSVAENSGGGGGLGAAIGAIGGAYLGSLAGQPQLGAQLGSQVGGSL